MGPRLIRPGLIDLLEHGSETEVQDASPESNMSVCLASDDAGLQPLEDLRRSVYTFEVPAVGEEDRDRRVDFGDILGQLLFPRHVDRTEHQRQRHPHQDDDDGENDQYLD